MSPLFNRHALWILFVLTLLLACSSGGESGTGAQDDQTTVGEVTGFGSIYVAGIHFNTDNVTIDADDEISSDDSNLAVGMVVKVVGTVSADGTEGVASEIYMTTGVEGLVFENNFAVDETMNVMGQTINITNDTHFNSQEPAITDFTEIVADRTAVEVHGFTDGQGEFFATMVNVVSNNGTAAEVKLLGRITSLAKAMNSGTFMLGNMNISFDADTYTEFEDGLTPGSLENDFYVAVEGASYSGTFAAPGVLQATEIEPAGQSEQEGTGYELEGVVTNIDLIDSNEFSLNGQRIVFDVMTNFEGGSEADIDLDIELEVEGTFQADGSILANEISFHTESDMEYEGTVDQVGADTITINGSSGLLTVKVNSSTSYEDEVNEMNHTFHFDDIVRDMELKVKYYIDADTMENIATHVERVTLG